MSKVLIVTKNFYPSNFGGTSTTLYNLSKGLVRSGIIVNVLTTNDHIDDNGFVTNCWIDLEGISVFYCSTRKNSKFHFCLIKYLRNLIKEADVLLLGSIFYPPNLFAAKLAKRYHKKIIWSPRGELFDSAINGSKAKLLYLRLIKRIFGRYVLFHGTSDREVEVLKEYFGEKSKHILIPNFLDFPARQLRHSRDFFFLFVGRIAPIKALEKIVEGLSLSYEFKKRDCRFLIAGPILSEYKDYYKLLMERIDGFSLTDRVKFIGAVSGIEKDQYYADAYMTLLLSESENFGNVVLESMAQGTPVIASKGTPWKVLQDNGIGYWVDNSPKSIANTIDNVLSLSDREYWLMRNEAESFSRNTYSLQKNISKWTEAIQT